MSISAEEKDRYLRETAIVLARERFHTDRTHTGGLRVLLDGAPLCEVTENGGITYRNEDINEPERIDAKDMNIRKAVDYSTMFVALKAVMKAVLPQMELYCKVGQIVCARLEKGAAVAAAEFLKEQYPDMTGFSPRNVRRMRDFWQMYSDMPVLRG